MQSILIVDNNEDFLADFSKALKNKLDCDVSFAPTGNQALAKIKVQRFSIIIIENSVKDIPGFELVGVLKSSAATRSIPVIVLSENQDPIILKRYANLDIDEFMFKPLDMEIAISKLENILAKQTSKVMIIDDHTGIQTFIQRVIKSKFFRDTIVANNGREAFELLKSEKPVLIILDIAMPEMSGVEFVKKLRNEKKYGNIPIVILSSNTDPEIIQEVVKFNISEYLAKPISIQELTVKLKKYFE
ncbi:MAG: response regulator [Ignavibacteria bacterium]|jgi:CheY-like chemotaxis protein